MKNRKLEISLAVGLLLVFIMSPFTAAQGLENKMTRLHVLANSDSESDQSLKLYVRDQLIKQADVLNGFYQYDTLDQVALDKIQRIAQNAVYMKGQYQPVVVERTNMYFDTRVYQGFSLPAGRYDTLRVVLGQGQGKNWWCVLFPPLCLPLATEELKSIAAESGLTEDEIGLITQDGKAYQVRFKIAELWGRLKK